MYRKSCMSLLMASALGFVAGCAAPVEKPTESGFLSDYSKLQEIDENYLIYSEGRTSDYSKFIVDPVIMLYKHPEGEEPEFTDEELEELKTYFHDQVTEELTKDGGYQIVTAAGPDIARIR